MRRFRPASALLRTQDGSLAIVAILLLAAVVRVVGVASHDFWYDEAIEIARDRMRWPQILFLVQGPDPPVFRLLMNPVAVRTSSAFWLRLPSVAFSVATVWLMWRWIVAMGDRRLAAIAALLIAIAPIQVYYAQEVSQYALSGFAAALVLFVAQRAVEGRTWANWMWFAVAGSLAVCSYYGLLFIVAAVDIVFFVVLVARRRLSGTRGLVAANLVVGAVVFILWFAMLRSQYAKFASTELHPPSLQSLREVAGVFAERLERDVLRFFWMPWSDAAPRWILLLPAALGSLGIASLWSRGGTWRVPPAIFVIALGGMWAAYCFGLYPFGFRYAFALSPLLFVFIAEALRLVASRWRVTGLGLGLVVIATQLYLLPNVSWPGRRWVAPPYENLGHVLDWVEMHKQPGLSIYLYYGSGPAFGEYRARTTMPVVRGAMFRQAPIEAKADSVRRSMKDRRRFFFVASHPWGSEHREVIARLTSGEHAPYRIVESVEDVGAYAALLEERPDASAGSISSTRIDGL